MSTQSPPAEAQPLATAWALAPVLAILVVATSGLLWGPRGMLAGALGSLLSLGNVWLLYRLGKKAVLRAEADGGQQALAPLQAGLGAKTVALMLAIALLTRVGGLHTEIAPLAMGLLVSVFALIGAGLRGAVVHR